MSKLFPLPRKLIALLIAILFTNGMLQAQSLQVTLTASNYNGYNISCFGAHDGNIATTVTGGTPPYTYEWSNGEQTSTINDLPAGYWHVIVTDALGGDDGRVEAEITLTEPDAIRIEATTAQHLNGFNISCYNCFNGSIAINVTGGYAPYSYLWSDGSTNQNRTALGRATYNLLVTDANGCTSPSGEIYLTEPERDDWRSTGNSGSNPTTNFIGTTDSVSLSFRTNNAERLKISGNGDLKIEKLAGSTNTFLTVDNDGLLKNYDPGNPVNPNHPDPFWKTNGNDFIGTNNYIGTMNNADLIFRTYVSSTGYFPNGEVMRLTADHKVGIGTSNPSEKFEVNGSVKLSVPVGIGIAPQANPAYALVVNGKVGVIEVAVKATSPWPDYVFNKNYNLLPIDVLEEFVNKYKHLPGMPSAKEITENENIELGALQIKLVEKTEENTQYIIELNKMVKAQQLEIEKLKKELRNKSH